MRASAPLLIAALFALTACGQSNDAIPGAPEPPADAPAAIPEAPPSPTTATDFTRPLNLLGNEPFWALKIRPEGLTFSAPDQADVTVANPRPAISGLEAVWTTAALKATLRAEVCQDGMSGLNYPFKATVETDGKTLTGCAAYADAMPREGG
jgi:uncharacterized membrane protein